MDPEPNHEPDVRSAVSDANSGASPGVGGDGLEAPGKSGDPSSTSARGVESSVVTAKKQKSSSKTRPKAGTHPNNVRKLRQRAMMSKAELARRAGVSPLTIDRVEAGCPCRMDTKRKILEALGLDPSKAQQVFPDVDLG